MSTCGVVLSNSECPTTSAYAWRITVTFAMTAGRLISTLVDQTQEPGYHSEPWVRTDVHGYRVPSGVYFDRLQAGEFTATRKMILLR